MLGAAMPMPASIALETLLPTAAAGPVPLLLLVGVAAALLFFGRRLFWLLVGVTGAVATLWLTTRVLELETGVASILAALAAGLVGALLAVLLQKAAVALVGFLGGAWAVLLLFGLFEPSHLPGEPWVIQAVAAVVGGVLGALAAAWLFEAALVVLTSLGGALLLVETLGLDHLAALVTGIALALVGVVTQTRGRRSRRERRHHRRRERGD